MKMPGMALILLAAASMQVTAQQVTFVRSSWLLAPATGSVPYVDCAVDMNGDFRDDVVRIGREGLFIDFQGPDGAYEQYFFPLPIRTLPTWSICAGDLNNDGANDLLFAGDSAVSFVQAADNAQRYVETVMPGYLLSQRSTLADIDIDGWLDGFVCNDKGRSVPYRNAGDGQMMPDTTLIRTADRPGNYAAIWTDHDNDGDADLYISKCQPGELPGNINRTNLLYRNNGNGTFTEQAEAAGIADNAQSWATVFEDFDNDGDFDMFVVNHDEANRLYRNNGDGTYTDVIADSGIDASDFGAFENAAVDFNNDGYFDVFAQLDRELYLGHGDLTFTGLDAPVIPGAIADLNGDGWLDVVHLGQAWLNQPGENHWAKVALLGVQGNRNGIGARIEAHGEWGTQVREVRAGQSYTPMHSLNVHFGLGTAEHIDSLVVKWPSGIRTVLDDIPADTFIVVAEAPCNGPAVEVTVPDAPFLCAGDTLQLLAPAGFDAYRWVPGGDADRIEVFQPGTYRVICFDSAGCVSVSREVVIRESRDKVPSILSPDGRRFCRGDSIRLLVDGGSDPVWSDGTAGVSSIVIEDPGTYRVTVTGACSNEPLASDPVRVEWVSADPPVAGEVVFLPGDSVRLSAEGEDCHWFDRPLGGNLLGTGPILETPTPDTNTTFFVEGHVRFQEVAQSGGKPDTTGGAGLPLQNGHLEFRAYAPFTIESVTVYLPESLPPGARFIQLWSRDSLLAFRRFDVVAGANRLPLEFAVDTGRYLLICPQGGLLGNTEALDYPYSLGDLGEITTSSTGVGAYYFFYDWHVRGPSIECISERTPVEVMVSAEEPLDPNADIRLFPVPSSGIVHLVIPEGSARYGRYEVCDAQGRQVLAGSWALGQPPQVDLSGLPDGWYVLHAVGKGRPLFRPIIKISRSGN